MRSQFVINQDRVFEGQSNKGQLANLPSGTYYYIIEGVDSEKKVEGVFPVISIVMKKIVPIFALLILFFSHSVKAQYDPLYNQYSFDQLLINPAYAGINDIFTVNLLYRQQWVNFEGAPRTVFLSSHTSIGRSSGAGMSLINEKFGVNNNVEAYGYYSYKINFGRSVLSMGLSGGIMSYNYDYSLLNLEYQDDPLFTPTDEKISQPNFGAGVWYQHEKYYVGLSMPRILEVDVDKPSGESNRYRRHFYVSAGGMVTLNTTLKLKPYTLVRIIDGAPANVDIGASLLISELIWAGVLLRDFDAVALLGQLEISDQFRVGLSAEIATTKLVTSSYGTYEIMLIMDFAAFQNQVLKRRYF